MRMDAEVEVRELGRVREGMIRVQVYVMVRAVVGREWNGRGGILAR